MAPRLTAARRCCKDGRHIQPGGFAISLSQDWACPVTIAGLDVVLQGWCIHAVGLGTVHRPGPLEHMHAAACIGYSTALQGPRFLTLMFEGARDKEAVSRSRMQLRMRDGQGAAAAWAMNRLRRLALPPSPGWAPPLPSWRGVGSALPARQPLFPSPAVADQAPGVAGAEQLRAREALQPDTLGPIFALGPGAVLD
jgi:hypothetical protein